MASGVIPQIQAVFGNCGGGMAVASEMADFTFMEQDAKMFVNAPFVIAENDADNSSAEYPSFRLTTRMTCLTANVRMT